jgi:mono/diheme cytochrome c family protein
VKLSLWLLLLGGSAAAADPGEFFETHVRPVLAKNCFGCHTSTHMGGLQLDSREHALQGGNSGAAIVPGHADQSLLIQAITQRHEKFKMPPGGKLKDDEIAAIEAWINSGAAWPESKAKPATSAYVITPAQRSFWAFQPVRQPAIPKGTAKSPVDRFIFAALNARGLKPVRAAERSDLIRRATFDLTGLPPTPEEVSAFAADQSPDAFAKVVDRLLASPRYGERWGRYWLDVARYSDDRLNSTQDDPYANAWRYRDWVIQAFNEDMPYDLFVKAQIAGDLVATDDRRRLEPGLGFYALSPEFQDDRVDATTRGFLGLTVACAQCHDHKYDPIPTADYYSLLGIFNNSEVYEYPLAPDDTVRNYTEQAKKVEKKEKELKEFIDQQTTQLADILAAKTVRFMLAAQKLDSGDGLDYRTLGRWQKYLKERTKEHPYLKGWFDAVAQADEAAVRKAAAEFQANVLAVNEEKKVIDEKNKITLGLNPNRSDLANANLQSLARDKYVLWRDLFEGRGVLRRSPEEIEDYLEGEWREHLKSLRAEVAGMKKALPPKYPFLHALRDASKPKTQKIYIRGDRANQGEPAPPHFLSILCAGAPPAFSRGSGRLELAEAIADPHNPLTARVMVNRIWQHHFGDGLVRTPSNFGELGERPTHPELLDYLARRLVENKWSIKAMHREIMLSAAYQLSADYSAANFAADPENRLLWRTNRQRLDAESLRDALLAVSGNLDLKMGGPPQKLDDAANHRRTVYGFVSRRKLDPMLGLFDFANPNNTSDRRLVTNVALQRLFFMNSELVAQQSRSFAGRLQSEPDDTARIRKAYRLLLGREARAEEIKLGLEFLKDADASWPRYAQVLLSCNEFGFVN